jgi:hypothetical protein
MVCGRCQTMMINIYTALNISQIVSTFAFLGGRDDLLMD